jgi:hypothetical protein
MAIISTKPIMLEEPLLPTNGAHEIFLERGGTPGLELDDWLQAELELVAVEIVKAQPALRKTAR